VGAFRKRSFAGHVNDARLGEAVHCELHCYLLFL
jgi:hypothetical protein